MKYLVKSEETGTVFGRDENLTELEASWMAEQMDRVFGTGYTVIIEGD